MPASHKMLKSREQAANRAAGIGDADGRLPARVKAEWVMLKCTVCNSEIRETKKNVEALQHFESRHGTSSFASCFPGTFDPTVAVVVDTSSSAPVAVAAAAPKKVKKTDDLSFLDNSLASKSGKKK